ncbi:MAG: hypothetical protein ACTSYL_01710 [Candidatus Thorarchaeota archaeon]
MTGIKGRKYRWLREGDLMAKSDGLAYVEYVMRNGEVRREALDPNREIAPIGGIPPTGAFLSLGQEGLVSIDLSPVAGLTNLTHVYLADNKLKEIDLTPLAQCPQLEMLDIS